MRTINAPTLDDLAYIGSWLCEADRIELALTRDPDNYVSLALDAFESDFKYVVLDDGVPVMAFGAKPIGPMAIVWGYKTDRGRLVVPMVTKFIKRTMIPALHKQGVSRAVCLVHPNNWASHGWLRHLGFTPRATTREFGTRHEEVLLFQRDDLQ